MFILGTAVTIAYVQECLSKLKIYLLPTSRCVAFLLERFFKVQNTTFVLKTLVSLFQVDQKPLQVLSFPV